MMSNCGTATVENLKIAITTELRSDAINDSFTYEMPFFMPGDSDSTEINITVENLKSTITVECDG